MRKKDDEKQKRIKTAVMELSLQEGFSGTSISKIAKKAGVSPATVYVYYENKEEMLKDIYTEYSEEVFSYIMERTQPDMTGAELISTLMRSYYSYIRDNSEVFSFVEQFSQCPALSCKCSGKKDICQVFSMIDHRKECGEIRDFSDESLADVMFYPVKAIAMSRSQSEEARQKRLEEVIRIIEYALIPD